MRKIALIAHDKKKDEMVEFAKKHVDFLSRCDLVATGTTGKLVQEKTGLKVKRMLLAHRRNLANRFSSCQRQNRCSDLSCGIPHSPAP